MAIEAPDVALDDDDEFGQEELEAAAAVGDAVMEEGGSAAASDGGVEGEGSLPATVPTGTHAADVTGSNPTPAMVGWCYWCCCCWVYWHYMCWLYTISLPSTQGEENQPPNVPPTKKPAMQITQKKYNMIKNLLTMKLQEVEDAQATAQQEGEAMVLEGMKQHDLTKWFFEHQQQRYGGGVGCTLFPGVHICFDIMSAYDQQHTTSPTIAVRCMRQRRRCSTRLCLWKRSSSG